MNNLEMMRKRFEWQGGIAQDERMIKDKFRTLQRALLYSYQACNVQIVQPRTDLLPYNEEEQKFELCVAEQFPQVRALINPDKLKQDYDDKIISLPYSHGYQPGDVFEWNNTNSYWLIYTQELTEDAYFRGEIRRCKYRINFKDENGVWCSTWAAIRGPVETKIDSIQKNQERVDKPNLSLNILMPLNEKTLKVFDRYTEFLFAGRCWRVQAPDTVSITGVIEINAEEYYINKQSDDIQQAMKNGLLIDVSDPNMHDTGIAGPTFIKPKIKEVFSVLVPNGKWSVKEDFPVRICPVDATSVEVTWMKGVSGQFTLVWTDGSVTMEKVVVVESLF